MVQLSSIKPFSFCILFGTVTLFFCSCSHYRWGTPVQYTPFQSVYVKPVANKADVPQAQALLSNQLISSLQQESLKTYSCEAQADATLEVVLVDYTLLAKSFEVTLAAEVTLINNNSNCSLIIDNRRVEASITALTDEGLQAIEYQDMPTLTRKLSKRIKDLVISAW